MVRLWLRRPLFDLILFPILFQSFSPLFCFCFCFCYIVAPRFVIKFCDDFSFAQFVSVFVFVILSSGSGRGYDWVDHVIVWASSRRRRLLSLVTITSGLRVLFLFQECAISFTYVINISGSSAQDR